jgi:hypothetical protein
VGIVPQFPGAKNLALRGFRPRYARALAPYGLILVLKLLTLNLYHLTGTTCCRTREKGYYAGNGTPYSRLNCTEKAGALSVPILFHGKLI